MAEHSTLRVVRVGGQAPSHPARRRPGRAVLAGVLVVLGLAVTACGGGGDPGDGRSLPLSTTTVAPPSTTSVVTVPPAAPSTTVLSPLAAVITPVGSMLYDPKAQVVGPPPVRVSLPVIGVRDAVVVDVGVQRNGELEVPAATEVGWYRFGARPGGPGSTVLAAHIAYNGVDGVFRRLANVRPGAEVLVGLADGSQQRYVVTAVERFDKDELPKSLFATTGPSQVVLITCGGAFNRELQSYEDNIVVTAQPVVS